ncbi:MAG: hypothetical protein D6806_17660, partial [Deltaproteobacteria bacterium]
MIGRVTIRSIAAVVLVLFAGCAGGERYDFCFSHTEAIFSPSDGIALPFPSNLYVEQDSSTDTGLRLALSPEDDTMFGQFPFVAEQLNRLDGFGTTASIVFGFSRELGTVDEGADPPVVVPPESIPSDPAETVLPGSAVIVAPFDPATGVVGSPVPVVAEYVSDPENPGPGRHLLLVEPAFPLEPATTYVAVLTSSLSDARGHCLSPSEETKILLRRQDPARFGLLGEQAPDAAWALVEAGLVESVDSISAVTVFTTQSVLGELLAARQQVLDYFSEHTDPVIESSLG